MDSSFIGPAKKRFSEHFFPLPGDEGELRIAVTVKDDDLIIAFGKPITWIGFHKEDVENLISILQERLKEMK